MYVLDVAQELAASGLPPCNPEDNAVWPFGDASNPWGAGIDGETAELKHTHQQYAMNWYVSKAIGESKYATRDMDAADVIFVNDYCYWTRYVAGDFRGGEEAHKEAARVIRQSTEAVRAMPIWKETNGRRFAMLHSQTVSVGLHLYGGLMCNEWKDTLQLVLERGQSCWQSGEPLDGAVIPYLSVKDLPIVRYGPGTRPTFLFYGGGCSDSWKRSAGQRMRGAAVAAMSGLAPDVMVQCSCSRCPGHLGHAAMLQTMAETTFCVMIAGDVQSSRRITEAILTGCIPVFIGAPFHAMPLTDVVDYASFALFFRIGNNTAVDPVIDKGAFEIWRLDADITSVVIEVEHFPDVYTSLRAVEESEIRTRQQKLEMYRNRFLYREALSPQDPGAVDSILHALCRRRMKSSRQ